MLFALVRIITFVLLLPIVLLGFLSGLIAQSFAFGIRKGVNYLDLDNR